MKTPNPAQQIIFVYNAKAGLLHGMMDSIHKLVSPGTYACQLCALTYGTFQMDARWREYLRTLPLPVTFHHRPDFEAAFPVARITLPAILLHDGNTLITLVSAEEMAPCKTLDDLIARMDAHLSTL